MKKNRTDFENWAYNNGYLNCWNIGYIDEELNCYSKEELSQKYTER